MNERAWPGITGPNGERHGDRYPKDETPAPLRYCESCGSFHGQTSIACNGHREPCDERCESVLGEIQCDRPANHLGEHIADSSHMRVEWLVKPW